MPAPGRLYIVVRDDAKNLFRAKTNEQLDAVVDDLQQRTLGTPAVGQCGTEWQQAHDQLLALDTDGPLASCLLGGRPLYQGPERQVILVRPDLVPHIASKLSEINADDMQGTPLSTLLPTLTDLYSRAAEQQAAVIFTT